MKIGKRKINIFVILLALAGLTYLTVNVLTKNEKTVSNPELKTVKDSWKGNPVDEDGNFVNHEFPVKNDFTRVIKWQFQTNPQKDEKKRDTFRLKVMNAESFLNDNRDGMLWIGHATFLFRIKGKLIITDPNFNTPSFFIKRFSKLPFNPELLKNIDYVLISHDHFDHLDKESIKLLVKNSPNLKLLTGLKLGKYAEDWLDGRKYQEAGWYQEFNITPSDISIVFLPARHWCSRGIGDNNERLWGSFLIRTDTLSVYFGGDSGFGSHFGEVKELFGAPDYSIIGIGAYKPEWFMSPSHTSPGDALKAAYEMSAKTFIPMHYGTFDLADEPLGEPYREVHKLYENYKNNFRMITPAIGEVVYF